MRSLRGSNDLARIEALIVVGCPQCEHGGGLSEGLGRANRWRLRSMKVDGPDHGCSVISQWSRPTRVLPMVHDSTGSAVDVVIGGPGLEEMFLEASESVSLGGLNIPVPTADHLVVMKLLAGRDTDLEDADAMVRAGGVDLDAVSNLVSIIAEGLSEDDIRQSLDQLRARLDRR